MRDEIGSVAPRDDGTYRGYPGLTKRELFAAAALQGRLATPTLTGTYEGYAYDAVRFADALIAELQK